MNSLSSLIRPFTSRMVVKPRWKWRLKSRAVEMKIERRSKRRVAAVAVAVMKSEIVGTKKETGFLERI